MKKRKRIKIKTKKISDDMYKHILELGLKYILNHRQRKAKQIVSDAIESGVTLFELVSAMTQAKYHNELVFVSESDRSDFVTMLELLKANTKVL